MSNSLNLYSGKTIIVFGAAGFIGRWVSRLLVQQGANLVQVDRDLSTAQAVLKQWHALGHLVELDITNTDAVYELLVRVRPAIIFNLVGYGISHQERDQKKYFQINANFVRELGQMLCQIPRSEWPGQYLVHTGSALEYGDIDGDLSEDSQPKPTTTYGISKLEGTLNIKQFGQLFGLNAITARLFTVYGPGEHPDRLLPSLIRAVREKTTLPLTSGGQQRDFTYVEEVAEGLLRLGLTDAMPGEIINLATGKLHSVRDFVNTAANLLEIPEECLNFGALSTRSEEMHHDPVTIRRLIDLTYWSPKMSIDEGIYKAITF